MEITKYDRIQTAKDDDLILVTNDLDGTRTIRHDDLMRETTQIKDGLTVRDGISFHFDYQDGKYGFNTDPNRGADTFVPFSSGEIDKAQLLEALAYSGLGLTEESTAEEIYEALANRFPAYFDMLSLPFTTTGSFTKSGNTFTLKPGSTWVETAAYTPFVDFTPFHNIELSGTLSIGIYGSADPSWVYLELCPENGALSIVNVGTLTASPSSMNLATKDISNLTGNYRLQLRGRTYNDGITAVINKALLVV